MIMIEEQLRHTDDHQLLNIDEDSLAKRDADSLHQVIVLINPPNLIISISNFGQDEHSMAPLFIFPEPVLSDPETSGTMKRKIRSSALCAFVGCSTQASFRHPNGKDRIFCAKHKGVGMIDFRSRKCEYPNCLTNASFNFYGMKKRRFCKIHAEPGMIVKRLFSEIPLVSVSLIMHVFFSIWGETCHLTQPCYQIKTAPVYKYATLKRNLLVIYMKYIF